MFWQDDVIVGPVIIARVIIKILYSADWNMEKKLTVCSNFLKNIKLYIFDKY
jgi:hypothetical protein